MGWKSMVKLTFMIGKCDKNWCILHSSLYLAAIKYAKDNVYVYVICTYCIWIYAGFLKETEYANYVPKIGCFSAAYTLKSGKCTVL